MPGELSALSPLLRAYDQVILDLDGCVWLGGRPTPRAPEAIAAIRAAGIRLVFVTNDGRQSPEEYVRRLWAIGCQASVEDVVSAGAALQFVLADGPAGTGAFVIGSPAIFRHVADAGCRILNHTPRAEQAEVVVVVGHDELRYRELVTATRALLAGAEMLAGCRDATFPEADGPAPGTGSIVAALETATGVRARSVGKPEPQMFATALDRLGEGRTLVIGDRLDSDLAGAAASGLDGAIVLTGVADRAQAEAATDPAPVAIAEDLGSLALGG
jgi:HAD superfamily hydrolase (TIGR01450 family)